ncbi:phosphate starvation-inducible protein PhoH [Deinococcus yavapaiensis KR-236]|uniref:PhoH-like protein n=1 Tax=Deinococcus yavapaiensis KR-236 TaxID=694435 RepID=A0A318SC94_9DEIO|nr:phosphate starvation-inducible protein PhoH [Deinococcus yavapaiensis KR-236]
MGGRIGEQKGTQHEYSLEAQRRDALRFACDKLQPHEKRAKCALAHFTGADAAPQYGRAHETRTFPTRCHAQGGHRAFGDSLKESTPVTVNIQLQNADEALALFGAGDVNLRKMRELSDARLVARGDTVTISGDRKEVEAAEKLVRDALGVVRGGGEVSLDTLERAARLGAEGRSLSAETNTGVSLPRGLRAKTPGQKVYLEAIENNDITFGIGPAGTGKTYLAVAMAVSYLKARKVKRIVLTRPAVEAGEKLGFLPGDLQAKIDPYLRPLYDALYDMLEQERFESYLASGTIEVAPLAFMRGRTLNDSFIILDEAQNTTGEQMKMFLTRMGFSSKVVVTGDVTQIDLPRHVTSGLAISKKVLGNIEGIAFHEFTEVDVVRHPLVGRIIKAYEKVEDAEENRRAARRGELLSIREDERDPQPHD